MNRTLLVVALSALALIATPMLAPPSLGQQTGVGPNPVATTEDAYQAYGRVWSDPQGCLRGDGEEAPEGVSPWAKGNECAVDFLTYDEAVAGGQFLVERFGGLVELIRLDEHYDDPEMRSVGVVRNFGTDSEGNPVVLERDRLPLYAFKVTDASSDIPEADRAHFAYSLSIHGLERQGLEGGIRAMEDLVTWAACERPEFVETTPACQTEGPFPKPIVESETERPVPTAGEALRNSVIYFTLSNPDGWSAGHRTTPIDPQDPAADPSNQPHGVFTRGNGNGVDMNRDWPTIGYTYSPYSPNSEPEVRSFGRLLTDAREATSAGRFAAGIDLHGMLDAYAFSYTLLGAGQRDYRKNAITVETSIRTWEDQTQRLCWSPWVGDADCSGQLDDGESCQRGTGGGTRGHIPACVADQWGTVLDTLGYTVTGILGDWMDSPIGLDGVGINNEMFVSAAFEQALVQTHIDGNKGLIYSQIAALLFEQETEYVPGGRVGYVVDPERLQVEGAERPENPGLPAQEDMDVLLPCSGDACQGGTMANEGQAPTFEFDVRGPEEDVWNGGISVIATRPAPGGQNIAPTTLALEYFDEERWQRVATARGGTTIVTANDPEAGRWRVVLGQPLDLPARLDIRFEPFEAEASPGQAPIDVSQMDFFTELNEFVPDDRDLEPVSIETVLSDPAALDAYDSLVVVDDLGDRAHVAESLDLDPEAWFGALRGFAERGGNLVLTDSALQATADLGIVDAEAVAEDTGIAGFYHFILDGETPTYADPERYPLTDRIDVPGAAEGEPGRRQAVEPTPIGYTPNLGLDPTPAMPFWGIERAAWEEGCGQEDCAVAATTNEAARISYGEARLGAGVVRIAGSLLPDPIFEPDEANDYRFGLSSYALTYTGYSVFENLVEYQRAGVEPGSGTLVRHAGPTRVETAAEVARAAYPDGAPAVLIATSREYADALVGAPLAAELGGPILLTEPDGLPSVTADVIGELGAGTAIVLGGEAAVGEVVADQLREMDISVERLAGGNRFGTAAAVADRLAGRGGPVLIAEGEHADPSRGWPDALSAAAYGAAVDQPVLLVNRDRLPEETLAALADRGAEEAVIIGGHAAVSEEVESEIADSGVATRRISGADRYETSVLVAAAAGEAGIDTPSVWLATGRNWPDALTGGAAAGTRGERLLLVDGLDPDGGAVSLDALSTLAASGLDTVHLLGGTAAITEEVEAAIGARLAE